MKSFVLLLPVESRLSAQLALLGQHWLAAALQGVWVFFSFFLALLEDSRDQP